MSPAETSIIAKGLAIGEVGGYDNIQNMAFKVIIFIIF